MVPEPRDPLWPAIDGRSYAPRRLLFGLLCTATTIACIVLLSTALGGNGLDGWDLAILLCFAVTLPWNVIGFWNAAIGLVLMRLGYTQRLAGMPPATPLGARTAILSCIRNEDAATVARNLDLMIAGLVASRETDRFEVWILSDSDRPECIAAEESVADRLARRWSGRLMVGYRRRQDNRGYKAGNIRDFLLANGEGFELALVLDADSLMDPETILGMARIMEANPRLGILQSLVVGLPSASAFTRPFQFGMRLGMRSYTLGSAWWQGDCGPYWGHNAMLRVGPFRAHCELPLLPGRPPLGGWVLSHDQVEAALMRRAGFEVRVLPVESGSWEENPPDLLEFIRRDLRWCQGNLQYLGLLGMPGLRPVSRFQLALAILMFLGSPAWVLLMVLGVARLGLAEQPSALVDPGPGLALFALVMTMTFAPKLAALGDLMLSASEHGGERRGFGGTLRILAGALSEAVFSMLLAPIMAIAHTVFMAGLPFGRTLGWAPQRRGLHAVTLREALGRLWPQTLVGIIGCLWLAAVGGTAAWPSPFFLGALVAVPLATVGASPGLGLFLTRIGLWRIPEETDPGSMLRRLDLPAIEAARGRRAPAQGSPVAEAASESAD
jgi:membrane glycosyltransferase